jgi:hypothetical protein
MANDFTGNPWSIDTAYSTIPSPGHIVGSMVKVISITWSDTTNAADQVIIKDRNGRVIVDAKAGQASAPSIIVATPSWVQGLFVPTLAANSKLSITVHKG